MNRKRRLVICPACKRQVVDHLRVLCSLPSSTFTGQMVCKRCNRQLARCSQEECTNEYLKPLSKQRGDETCCPECIEKKKAAKK